MSSAFLKGKTHSTHEAYENQKLKFQTIVTFAQETLCIKRLLPIKKKNFYQESSISVDIISLSRYETKYISTKLSHQREFVQKIVMFYSVFQF